MGLRPPASLLFLGVLLCASYVVSSEWVIGTATVPEDHLTVKCLAKMLQTNTSMPGWYVGECRKAITTVIEPGSPVIASYSPSFISRYEGDDVLLSCTVKDKDDHTVSWTFLGSTPISLFHETNRVHRDRRFKIESDGNSTYNLRITGIMRDDQGKYLCQVNTLPRPTTLNITLQVVVAPEILGIFPVSGATPTLEKNNSNRFAYNESDDVMLTCQAVGSPEPRITWRFMVNTSFNIVLSTSATLSIPNIKREQAGVYTCTAENGYREFPKERWITINVQFKPEVVADEQDIRCGEGDYRQLRCQVKAIPPATFTWIKDNELLSGRDVSLKSKMLQSVDCGNRTSFVLVSVNPEADYGVYRCQATNMLGTSEDVIEVSGRLREPKIVSDPVGTRRHSYKLVWVMGSRTQQLQGMAGYTPIDGYTLSYYGWWFQENEMGEIEKVFSHSPEAPLEVDIPHDPELVRQSYVLRDLKSNVPYVAILRGYNRYGDGDSVTFTFNTSQEKPSSTAQVNTWLTTTAAAKKTIAVRELTTASANRASFEPWKSAGSSQHCACTETVIFIAALWILLRSS
ncbi:opioid-binding protein/cell adhesion molecule-like isoform X2 [Acanthaster planci]|uniref:Opioid-binding protein/cell adhesion molecule-like isoform X2 n=1 Tax=Acanthaster planci TaxID=133434 RepID=A0A8B7ZDS0_ACAPL|nr:opioid-binding protein/cell adhesion molecule-like isoform X2 [Acanthaster planci]